MALKSKRSARRRALRRYALLLLAALLPACTTSDRIVRPPPPPRLPSPTEPETHPDYADPAAGRPDHLPRRSRP